MDNINFDEIFEDAMRRDPGYTLPDYFVKGVNERIARKLAFRLQLKMVMSYCLILAVAVGLVAAANYSIVSYFPQYIKYMVNSGAVAALAALIIFILIMDKVVLGYLELRKMQH